MNPTHGRLPQRQYEIVIDEDRRAAGWGNCFAVVASDRPKEYLFLGGEAETKIKLSRMNRPRIGFGPFVPR